MNGAGLMAMADLSELKQAVERYLETLSPERWSFAAGLLALVGGLVLLRYGWSLYRAYLVLNGILIGVVAGTILGIWGLRLHSADAWITGLIGGLALGLLAVPLFRAALFVSAGGWAAAVLHWVAVGSGWNDWARLAGIAAAFMLFGAGTILLFRLMVIVAMAAHAASLTCLGTLTLLRLHSPGAADWLIETQVLLGIVSSGLFLIGLFLQASASRRGAAKKAERSAVAKTRAKIRKKQGRS